jgi:predicted Kef-type K+ transport protein
MFTIIVIGIVLVFVMGVIAWRVMRGEDPRTGHKD